MDRVRFGRALGFGARQAMKTMVAAVDAATAEDPSAKTHPNSYTPPAKTMASSPAASGSASQRPVSAPAQRAAQSAAQAAAQSAARTVNQGRQVKEGVGRGSKRLGEAVWGPVVRLSGVLWLEVSGVFFGIFALMALQYLWKLRAAWHSGAASHRNLIGAAIMFALFGYFCVSNFVHARRRERGR